jgi:hypothetical protein
VTYADGIVCGYFVSCVSNNDVCQTTFLVHDTLEVAFIVRKRRLRFLREALNAAECRVLDDDYLMVRLRISFKNERKGVPSVAK